MKYKNYQVEDFVADLDFIRWVTNPDADDQHFWNQWIAENPGKKPIIDEARLIVVSLKSVVNYPPYSPHELQKSKLHVIQNMGKKRNPGFLPWAAVIGFLIAVTAILYLNIPSPNQIHYQTTFAETIEVSLPDGSQVVLNANSEIKYVDNWQNTGEREVWLNGEAFFEVKKMTFNNQPGKFTIHTESGVQVSVLGTSFNVNDRKGNSEVVLNSGKVKLINPGVNQEVIMQPGDLVSYQSQSGKIEKKKVDPAQYTQWTSQQLTFNDEPLNKIIERVETLFGLQVQFVNFDPNGKRFTGSTPYQDVEILLLTIAKAYGLAYEKNGNSIKLK